jgi:hypothetical protein
MTLDDDGTLDVDSLLESFVSGDGYSAVEIDWADYGVDVPADTYDWSNYDVNAASSARLQRQEGVGEEGGTGLLGTLTNAGNSALSWMNQNPELTRLIAGGVGGAVAGKNARDAQRATAARDDKAWERQRQAEAEDRQRLNDSVMGLESVFKNKGPIPDLTRRDGTPMMKKGRYQ